MSDGEEWKGESDSDDQPSFSSLFSFWGTPLTAEQKAEAERRAAELKAKADLLGSMLPAFRPDARCVKCGHGESKTKYCAGSETGYDHGCYPHAGCHEHFHRTCKQCRYVWYERTLSEEGQ